MKQVVTLRDYVDHRFESLKAYLERIQDERDRRYDDARRSSEIAVNAALAAQQLAVREAFAASEKANIKTEHAQETYNEAHNDLLRAMDKQALGMMPRPEMLGLIQNIEDKMESMQANFASQLVSQQANTDHALSTLTTLVTNVMADLTERKGRSNGVSAVVAYVIAGIGILIALSRFLP